MKRTWGGAPLFATFPTLPDSPPAHPEENESAISPKGDDGWRSSKLPFDGKKEEENIDFFFIVKISIYIVTAEISANTHGEAMR